MKQLGKGWAMKSVETKMGKVIGKWGEGVKGGGEKGGEKGI
jgi:hypothetical protein